MSMYKLITASTLIKPSAGFFTGIFTSSLSGTPTITIYDSFDANPDPSEIVVDAFTPVASVMALNDIDEAMFFQRGIYVSITGTATVTVFFR